MAAVGLLYVGAVSFVNAVMLLGKAEPRSVGIFNLFVGVLQVVVWNYPGWRTNFSYATATPSIVACS